MDALFRRWVADVTGGTVEKVERATLGASRATWLLDVRRNDGSLSELVLRHDTGDGPLSDTELSMTREAQLYRALNRAGIKAPTLIAASPDGTATLVTRVPGRADFAGLNDEQRDAVIESFFVELARLHSLDPDMLDTGFRRPSNAQENALCDLDLWHAIFERYDRKAPLTRWLFGWLRRHAPDEVDGTVLCHGDCGPGNFLHHDGELSAILDWEFAHLGDPMDDLAWILTRATQMGLPGLEEHFERYADLAGVALDWDRIRYYQIFVGVRMIVSCLGALERRSGNMNAAIYFNLPMVLNVHLVSLVAAYEGVELPVADIAVGRTDTGDTEVLDSIADDLANVLLPDLTDPNARARATGMQSLIAHLQAVEVRGPAVAEAELADLADLLGRRPATMGHGWAALDDHVRTTGADHDAQLLVYFGRMAQRQLILWPGMGFMTAAAVE